MFHVPCFMYISLDWLKDFVKIPKSISPEELGLRLTMHTVEIDGVSKQADKFGHVVAGKILEVNPHPNADKLQLAKVDVKNEILEIVCGAPNIEPGQKVPVALVGAVLPGGFTIKEAEIRGVKSRGMLCAEDELGLGDDHSGIMILDKKAVPGRKLADYLGIKDVVFEVDNKSITHRPDLWSHYGIAREISAFLNTSMRVNYADLGRADMKVDVDDKNEKDGFSVKVHDPELCPRYMAVTMDNIAIAPSPRWIRERLIAVGIRPINNVVDATNYVMAELGQPLHAFTRKLVDEIVVRRAGDGERIETLDGQTRKLDKDMLVIADSAKPVAIAGIMGGANSEIDPDTTSIIIEAANFDFISIRKTSQKLGLRTDASMRYEKALDPNLCAVALARVTGLIRELCPRARITGPVIDERKFALNQGPIRLDSRWLNSFVGARIGKDKVKAILARLGFGVEDDNGILSVTVPTWRATRDISAKEDLAEEVARIYGYDNIPPRMPAVEMAIPVDSAERLFTRKIKNILAGAPALSEASNYSFAGEELLRKMGLDPSAYIRLANPISASHTMLRKGLAPNLILNVKTNQAGYEEVKLFEIGSVYLPEMEGKEDMDGGPDKLPYQEKRLGIACAGDDRHEAFGFAKGAVEYLASKLGLSVVFSATENVPAWADPAMSAEIKAGDKVIGLVGGVSARVAKRVGLKKRAVIAEISIKELLDRFSRAGGARFRAGDKFPPVTRDLAFVVSEKVLYNDIRDEILGFHKYLSKAELFDVFTGEKLGKGKKSLAFHIIYRAGDRTLTAKEADKLQNALIKRLREKFEAVVRDF